MFNDSRAIFAKKLLESHPEVLNTPENIMFKSGGESALVDASTLELISATSMDKVVNIDGLQEPHFAKLYWQIFTQTFGLTSLEKDSSMLNVQLPSGHYYNDNIPAINDYKAALTPFSNAIDNGATGLLLEQSKEQISIIQSLL
jgi:hypothetical protein